MDGSYEEKNSYQFSNKDLYFSNQPKSSKAKLLVKLLMEKDKAK